MATAFEGSTGFAVQQFGTSPEGTPVHLYTLSNSTLEIALTDFGARLVSVLAPDREGRRAHVVLGFESLETYLDDLNMFSGAIVGRFGNRLAHGRFSIDGKPYQVPLNNGPNALHGGPEGFDRRLWQARQVDHGIEFTLVSPAGDQGFPGTLTATVCYTLEGSALRIEYTATTDAATIVNLTNHAYFNLAGESCGTILDHEITLTAALYTPVDPTMIPLGELAPVAGTPFDLRTATRVGSQIDEPNQQLERARGFDHSWAMGKPGTMKLAAVVRDPATGRTLTVETTEPGVQFYTGNFLDGTLPNRTGGRYMQRAGLCLETQHYPDSPNQPGFPSTELRPGQPMRSTTIFSFGVS